jgi:hypothetical protein
LHSSDLGLGLGSGLGSVLGRQGLVLHSGLGLLGRPWAVAVGPGGGADAGSWWARLGFTFRVGLLERRLTFRFQRQ